MIQKKITKDNLRKKAIVIAPILLVLGLAYAYYASFYESTDDAFLDTHVVAVNSRVAGHVATVHITDNQLVKKGDALVDLDPRDSEVRLKQAEADLIEAQSELKRATGDVSRYEPLLGRDEVSKQAFANVEAAAQKAQAKVDFASAKKKQAELELSYTKIAAPWDGRVTKKAVEPGAYVQVGQPLFALVSQDLWVIANFKENQISRMKAGQPVTITIDALDQEFKGHVDSLQAGSGARFSLFPPENATGNFVKIVQRVPVKIVFDEKLPDALVLGPGLSVVPEVRIK